ncbi:MAG: ABC transporter ATP-binding protein/permease [Clostridia bacterium]|nr:ABC transporter ATP-binding protein/permease [Clostridia bacterium]
MLQLINVTKDYQVADSKVHALKGISISFRKSEFVSVLGPSGCGKTTLLNIIGGLDKYTDGDLIIGGVSTKEYKDRDWDAYRNHSIGFVFQSYNLIPHQTVLKNVELALTLSGVGISERKERAIKALEEVGLKDQIGKRPNQLSGGQMQRVAIARALVNNPDIILADEPTGALDSETSVQVMEILKNVAKNKLVIMVTHNPELAEKYSSRIVRMLDGNIIDDTMPLNNTKKQISQKKQDNTKKKVKVKKPTMSFWTAFKLSLNNLFTKKGRTVLTSFAGSIGIIGIALILAVSQGTTGYINHVQESTLSSYPITIQTESMDLTSLMESFMGVGGSSQHDKDAVYKDPIIGEMVNALSTTGTNKNDLKAFKAFLDSELEKEESELSKAVSGIQYTYDLNLDIYTKNVDGEIIKSDTAELMNEMLAKYMKAMLNNGNYEGASGSTNAGTMMNSPMSFMSGASGMWQEFLPGKSDGALINDLIYEQYELIDGGSWPNEYNEIVLIVNENNELDDLTLYALGLLSQTEIDAIIDSAVNGTKLEDDGKKWTYEELKEMTFRTILPADRYQNRGDGVYIDASKLLLESLYERSLELKVTGIIRPKKDADVTMLSSGIGYTKLLTEHVIEKSKESAVVKAQLENPEVDVLTGLPFENSVDTMSIEEKALAFKEYISEYSEAKKSEIYIDILCLKAEEQQLEGMVNMYVQQFQTNEAFKTQIIDTVITAYAQQLGVEKEVLFSYLEEATEEELLVYVTPMFEEMAKQQIRNAVTENNSGLSESQKALMLDNLIASAENKDLAKYYEEIAEFSSFTYEDNLIKFGCLNIDTPFTINIYASSFENKDAIVEQIDKYNKTVDKEQEIKYNDYVGLLMSSVTQIINAITYVLIAFVSISLIVSSIMIGVITLISVQERTKEIGILRAIGASKRDVSSMFNAETLIIGFSSGMLGVLVTYLLCIPINFILHALTGLSTLSAVLPVNGAIILVVISMLLTLISGIIPSRSAAKKDPVEALRSE